MNEVSVIKRRNAPETKLKILVAAQQLFAEKGYAKTGLRDIAKLAGVTSALPVRYFNTKAGIFEAALAHALELGFLLSNEKKDFGKRLVETVLDKGRPITVPAMIALSIGDEESAAISSRFAKHNIIQPIAQWLGPPRATARASAILMLSTAFIIYNRHIIIDDSLSKSSGVAKWLENSAQMIVDGDEEMMKLFLRLRPPK